MTRQFIRHMISTATSLIVMVAFVASLVVNPATAYASSGSGLEEIAAVWADKVSNDICKATSNVALRENALLDANNGDIRKLDTDTVLKDEFGIECTEIIVEGGERIRHYNVGDWAIDWSMTKAYAGYNSRASVAYNEKYDASIWFYTDADGILEFTIQCGSEMGDPCEFVDLAQAFTFRDLSQMVIICEEGGYVASPTEIALIGLVAECCQEETEEANGIMSCRELDNIQYNYAMLCNNYVNASSASRVVEEMLDEGRDIRDIRVIDVLSNMMPGSSPVNLLFATDNAFGFEMEGNVVSFYLEENQAGFYNPSKICFGGYKNGKKLTISIKPSYDGVIETVMSSGGINSTCNAFVINEDDSFDYHVQINDREDSTIDCALIAQIFASLYICSSSCS